MAGQVGKLTLKAVIDGFEDVQGLGKALKQVAGTANQTDASFKNITTRVKEFARQNVKTTDSIRGQIAAFTKLRGSAAIASDSYTSLTRNIQNLRRELTNLDTAEEKRAKKERLRQMGFTETDIRREMRSESQLYQRATGRNVYDQTTRGIRQGILNQKVADTPMILQGKVNQEYVQSFVEATKENDEFTQLQNRLNLKIQAQLATQQVSSQFATPTVLGPKSDTRFLKRKPRYQGVYGPIEDPTNKDFFTKIMRASLGVMGEAFPGRKGLGLSFRPGFTADPDARDNPADWINDFKRPMDVARQIVDRRMGGGKRRTSISAMYGSNLRDDLFVPENVQKYQTHTDRLPGFRKDPVTGRFMSGGGQKYDQFRSAASVPDQPIFYSDIATGDVRARGGRLGKIVGGPSKTVGPDFPKTPAGDAANIQALNKQLLNLKTNSKGAKDVRQKLLEIENRMSREMRKAQGVVGDLTQKEQQRVRVQEKLAKRQAEYGGAGKIGTRDPRTGAMIAGGSGTFGMPVPTQVREISGLYDSISRIGMSKISSDIDRMGKSYEEVRKDILAAAQAGNKSVNSLNSQRSAFVQLRDGMNPASKGFKQLTKDIQNVDKALAKLNSNKFSGQNLRRTGQSILGAGFVGGPAGFLGAGIGAGVEALRPGGDMAGGAITGGLVASQVLTPVSQAIGGATTYASDIEKANIALRGVTKSTENYEVAQAAIKKAVEEYNVPQEVATRGMTRLSAAVLGAGGNIHNATEAFLNTTVAIKGTAGSADDVKSAITAMVQIFSKGKVSAEELSGQLGERFPAAVTKFAKANNISTQQLQKNLKDGTVGLDMLSKFITSLGDEYEPLAKKIAASNEEAGARSQIAMNKMKIAVGNALKPIGADFQIIGAQLLVDLIPAIESVAQIAASVFKPLAAIVGFLSKQFDLLAGFVTTLSGALIGLAIQKTIVAFGTLSTAVKGATVSWAAFNKVIMANKFVAAGTAIAGLIFLISKLGRSYKQAAEQIKKGLMGQSIEQTEEELLKIEERLKALKVIIDANESRRFGRVPGFIKKEFDKLMNEKKAYEEFIEAETRVSEKAKFDALQREKTAKSPFVQFKAELEEFEVALENVAVSGFKKMEDAILQFVQTGKLAFKDLVRSVIADLTRLMIRQTVTKPLFNAFTSALTGGFSLSGGGSGFSADDFISGGYTAGQADIVGSGGFLESVISAKGNTFARNGIVPYYKGGVIRNPTMSLMGEAGPEAILPLQRGRGGRLGVVMQGGGGGTTNVNYTGPTLNFNGDEYVPKAAVGGIINAAAKQGASMGQTSTMRSLQNNRSARSRIGM